jgi:glycosyltransferase involved in cell wall biosynthesis
MPAYNSAAFIEESIKSVLAQTYKAWELLIVDDCSTDDTGNIIDEWYRKDNRIKSFRLEKNSGAAVARNKALLHAKGRYIALLDSDDIWHPEKLKKQVAFMQDNGATLTHTAYQEIDENGKLVLGIIKAPKSTTYDQMLNNSVIGCPTAMYDSESLGKVEMPNVFHEDYATWLKILGNGSVAKGLDESLAYYRIHKGSLNRNKIKAAWYRWRVYRYSEGLPLGKSISYFASYLFSGVKKTYF